MAHASAKAASDSRARSAGKTASPQSDAFDNSYRAPAPTVGQHTAEVLGELGLTDGEIQRLAMLGITAPLS